MGKTGRKKQKVLARIQNSCYNGYARKPLGLSRNNAKILSALGTKKLLFSKTVGTHIFRRRSRRSDERKTRQSLQSKWSKKRSPT